MAICGHSKGKAQGKCPSHKVAQEFSHKPPGGYKGKGRRRRMGMPRKDANGYY